MHRYEMSTPRLTLCTAAAALTAITMSVLVVVPAIVEADAQEPDVETQTGALARPASDLIALHESAAGPCLPPSRTAD